jgi:hypothetical protein
MGWREDLSNFDLGRLTLLGWFVFLLSIAAGIGAAIVVGTYWDANFPAPPDAKPRRVGPAGIAGFVGALGFFFAVKGLFHLAGVRLMRPKAEQFVQINEQEIVRLRRRLSRANKWCLFFILLMPLGFVLPCGVAVALASASAGPVPEGITLPQILAMIALGLPFIGLVGWLVMRGEKAKYAQSLAVAEQASAGEKKDGNDTGDILRSG